MTVLTCWSEKPSYTSSLYIRVIQVLVGTDAASHLLDCLSKEVYKVLFSTYGEGVRSQGEKVLTDNFKRLVVRTRLGYHV